MAVGMTRQGARRKRQHFSIPTASLFLLLASGINAPVRAQNFGPSDAVPTTQVLPAQPAGNSTVTTPAPNPAQPANGPVAAPAAASETPTAPLEIEVGSTQLEELKARLDAATDLDEAAKELIKTQIQKAADDVKLAQRLEASREAFTIRQSQIAAEKTRLSAELEHLRGSPTTRPSSYSSVEDLERTLSEKQQALTQAQAELSTLTTEIEQRGTRKNQLRETISSSPQRIADVNQRLQALSASNEPALVVDARRAALLAEKRRLERETPAAQSELALLDAEDASSLILVKETLLKNRIATIREQVDAWTSQLITRRRDVAEKRLESAQNGLLGSPDILVDVYKDMILFAQAELDIRQKRQQLQSLLDGIEADREKLDAAIEQARQRESRAGNSPAFGIRLRQERRLLANTARMEQQRRARLADLEQAQVDYLNWRDAADQLQTADQFLQEHSSALDAAEFEDEQRDALVGQIRTELRQRIDYANATIRAYDDYIDMLVTLDLEQTGFIEANRDFAAYIDERVLWIRSHPALKPQDALGDYQGLREILGFEFWRPVRDFFWQDLFDFPIWHGVTALIWVSLLASMRRLRALINRLGQKASNRLNTSMAPTFRASLATAVLSTAVTFPLWMLGWRAWQAPLAPDLVREFGKTLGILATGIYVLELTYQICRPGGVGEAHFSWPERVCRLAALHTRTLLLLGTPLAACIAILWLRDDRESVDGLGRILMILLALLVAFAFNRLTRRASGVMMEWVESNRGGWLDRLHSLWHAVAVAVPLALGVLTYIGYDYTAVRLSAKLALSYVLIFTLIFLRALLFRWLSFRQRRLAVDQARQQRAAAAAAAAAAEATLYPGALNQGSESSAVRQPAPQIAASTLANISTQSKRLLQTSITVLGLFGLWLIWIDVLPALNYFNRWTLPGTQVTYTAVVISVVAIIITTTAARNIPGLLEILILQRLPLDRSAKYAIGAISRYLIILVGLLVVSENLGIGWDQVQWLVAALTFGLGFGLQEIFANFVSGIILLFEQPIRVGDVVTVDGISGTVSRIRARATTITDWDRKEYIVPNREFITGKLLNWTLTDTVNRIVVNVGVSYDADPAKVTKIIRDVVDEQPWILKEPAPSVAFEGFGDSALNFVVRAFLPDLEHRLDTVDSLHSQIFQALRKAKIDIPYPQRDLHIRSGLPREFLAALSAQTSNIAVTSQNGEAVSSQV